jgi:ribose 5-phosphate isomerase B
MLAVALGADHAGWELKEACKAWLIDHGHQVLDFGTHSPESVDYPDYAAQVAEAVAVGKVDRGVLVCGTGIGMAITANKVPGVRAAACSDTFTARMSREHNDANVLCLGARLTSRETARDILQIWVDTPFAGDRHARRVGKISALEQRLRGERCG